MYIQHNIHLEQVGADSAESLASFVEIKFSALANAEKEVEEDEKVDQYLVHSLDSTMASAVCNDKKMGKEEAQTLFDKVFQVKEQVLEHYDDCILWTHVNRKAVPAKVFFTQSQLYVAAVRTSLRKYIFPYTSILRVSLGNATSDKDFTNILGVCFTVRPLSYYAISGFGVPAHRVCRSFLRRWRKAVLQHVLASRGNKTHRLSSPNSFLYRLTDRDKEILQQTFEMLSEDVSCFFPPMLRLPSVTGIAGSLLFEDEASLWLPQDMFQPICGRVYATWQYFCFRSADAAPSHFYLFDMTNPNENHRRIMTSLSFNDISDITAEAELPNSGGNHAKITTQSGWLLYLSFKKGSTFSLVYQLWSMATCKENEASGHTLFATCSNSPRELNFERGASLDQGGARSKKRNRSISGKSSSRRAPSPIHSGRNVPSLPLQKMVILAQSAKTSGQAFLPLKKSPSSNSNWYLQFYSDSETTSGDDGTKIYRSRADDELYASWKKFAALACMPNMTTFAEQEPLNKLASVSAPAHAWGTPRAGTDFTRKNARSRFATLGGKFKEKPAPENEKCTPDGETSLSKDLVMDGILRCIGEDLLRSSELLTQIRKGVPNVLRPLIWQITSGSVYKYQCGECSRPHVCVLQCKSNCKLGKKSYKDYLGHHLLKESESTQEIEKDLHRTMPSHPLYQDEDGLNKLRRVLVAYSWKNQEIGYCQSLNVIAALLLCFLNEEQTFWMTAQICEEILPDRYTPTMIGTMVDQQALQSLLETHIPDVAEHLEMVGVPLPLLTLPWFLCMFIGYLPWECSLRVLDNFFAEGVIVFFRVALAVLNLKREKILAEEDSMEIVEMLKHNIEVDAGELFDLVNTYMEDVSAPIVADIREFHYPDVLRQVNQQHEFDAESNRVDEEIEIETSDSEDSDIDDAREDVVLDALRDVMSSDDDSQAEKSDLTSSTEGDAVPQLVVQRTNSKLPSVLPEGDVERAPAPMSASGSTPLSTYTSITPSQSVSPSQTLLAPLASISPLRENDNPSIDGTLSVAPAEGPHITSPSQPTEFKRRLRKAHGGSRIGTDKPAVVISASTLAADGSPQVEKPGRHRQRGDRSTHRRMASIDFRHKPPEALREFLMQQQTLARTRKNKSDVSAELLGKDASAKKSGGEENEEKRQTEEEVRHMEEVKGFVREQKSFEETATRGRPKSSLTVRLNKSPVEGGSGNSGGKGDFPKVSPRSIRKGRRNTLEHTFMPQARPISVLDVVNHFRSSGRNDESECDVAGPSCKPASMDLKRVASTPNAQTMGDENRTN